ncbi:MAG: response regulator, partial [Actinomycetota bacterium]|nr:response regulator [Actinomycetota bacterium]
MTGPSVRVLVVDDSVVVRRVVQDVLQAERDFEVVATAVDGEAALEVLERLPVDVVILDVEMPRLDGLETLRRLRPRWPSLPVIMFSNLTK